VCGAYSFQIPSNSFGRTSVMNARLCDPNGSKPDSQGMEEQGSGATFAGHRYRKLNSDQCVQMFSPPVPRAACSHSHLSE